MKKFLKACLKEAFKQLVGTKKSSRFVYTKNARLKMSEYRITERQINEVFTRGRNVKEGMMTRDYNGYHIGIFYTVDKATAASVIISCWKRKSRK